jgi:hypothetical protein
MAQQKERSVVPTARRRYGGGGPGKPFAPGTNSHDGQVFRRGSDLIPRGDITSLYPVLMQDDGAIAIELLSYTAAAARKLPLRLQLGRAILNAAMNPRLGTIVAEHIADRLEGKAVQKPRHELPHTTYFYRAGDPVPPPVAAAEAARAKSAGDGVTSPVTASDLEAL